MPRSPAKKRNKRGNKPHPTRRTLRDTPARDVSTPSTPPRDVPRARGAPTVRTGTGSQVAGARRAGTSKGPDPAVAAAEERFERLREIEREERRLAKEKRELVAPTNAAMAPPVLPFRGDIEKLRGAKYHTWFKAAGAFPDYDIGSSPKIGELLEEGDEFDLPRVFYSQAITGRVKWYGIVDREYLIADLNDKAPWAGNDFRDIYPKWEYVYRVYESIGDVVVRVYEYSAKQPRNAREKRKGVMNN